MRFGRGFWAHEKFRDVVAEIVGNPIVQPGYTKVKIKFWSLGWVGNPTIIFPEKPTQWIKIFRKEYPRWRRISGDQLYRTVDNFGPESVGWSGETGNGFSKLKS